MTLIDVFVGLPFIAKIVVGFIGAIWAFEFFLLPFQFNLLCYRIKVIDDLLRQLLKNSERNKEENIDIHSLLSLVLGEIARKK